MTRSAISSASGHRNYWNAVAHIGLQVADALDYASGQGILHRDIKPSNLLLDDCGTVWITDFGLAKSASDGALTETGDVLGTLRYMAPEVLRGQQDQRSDLYSLGLTLYEMLALEPVFGETARHQLLLQVSESRVVPLRRKVHGIPADLETIIMKAAAREPATRYQAASAMADDLRSFLAGRPIRARSAGPLERLWLWCRRNPAVASLSALLLVALIGVTSATSLAYLRERAHGREIETKNTEVGRALVHEQESKAAESAAKDHATQRLYHSLVDQARANRLSRRAGQRFKSLEILTEASRMARDMSLPEEELLDVRNEAIACLTLHDVRTAKEWNGWPTGSFAVDFDDALERYARVDRDGNVSVRRVADDRELCSLPGMGSGAAWPQFSPDGRFCALLNVNGFRVWNLADREPVVVRERSRGWPAFSPDSRQLFSSDAGGLVIVFDLPSGRPRDILKTDVDLLSLACHPRGQKLAVGYNAGIQIRDLKTRDLLQDLPQPAGAEALAWHPDGRTLAALGSDRVIQIWDVASGQSTIQLKGHQNGGIHFAFSRGGDVLASTSWDGTMRLWDPRTGDQLFQTPSAIQSLRISRDGQRLAVRIAGDGQLSLLEVAIVGRFYRTLVRDPVLGRGVYFLPAISPDGRLLAVGMSDGVGLWNLATGEPLTFLPTGTHYAVRFDPCGALLTSGNSGLVRWPIVVDPAAPGRLRIGPPEQLPLSGPSHRFGTSRDGRVVAKAMRPGGLVWHQDRPGPPVALGPHEDNRYIDVSPDGRWVATGSHSHSIHVWNLRAIREQLAEMGLDWDLPAYPPLPAGADRPGLQLEVDRALPTFIDLEAIESFRIYRARSLRNGDQALPDVRNGR